MPMKYKVDVIAALKDAGYNTGTIRKEKIMGSDAPKDQKRSDGVLGNLGNDLRTAELSARRSG